jgi:hypothetical protein
MRHPFEVSLLSFHVASEASHTAGFGRVAQLLVSQRV